MLCAAVVMRWRIHMSSSNNNRQRKADTMRSGSDLSHCAFASRPPMRCASSLPLSLLFVLLLLLLSLHRSLPLLSFSPLSLHLLSSSPSPCPSSQSLFPPSLLPFLPSSQSVLALLSSLSPSPFFSFFTVRPCSAFFSFTLSFLLLVLLLHPSVFSLLVSSLSFLLLVLFSL